MSEAQEFVFWLTYISHRAGFMPMRWPKQNLGLCKISATTIVLQDNSGRQEDFLLASIESCKEFRNTYKGGGELYAVLTLKSEDKIDTFYLKAADIIYRTDSPVETDNLISIIDTLRSGETPELNPNPYYREFERRGRLKEYISAEWDADTPPDQYSQRIIVKHMISQSNVDMLWILYFVLGASLIFSFILLFNREVEGGIVWGLFVLIATIPFIYLIRRQNKRYTKLLAEETSRKLKILSE